MCARPFHFGPSLDEEMIESWLDGLTRRYERKEDIDLLKKHLDTAISWTKKQRNR